MEWHLYAWLKIKDQGREDGLFFSHHNFWLLESSFSFHLITEERANSKLWTHFRDGPDGSVSVLIDLCGIWLLVHWSSYPGPFLSTQSPLVSFCHIPRSRSLEGWPLPWASVRGGAVIWKSDTRNRHSAWVLALWQWDNGSLSLRDLCY